MIPDSCLHIRGLSDDRIRSFLSLAVSIKRDPEKYSQTLKGKTVLQFFVENSTRTRMSFEAATRKLGGTSVVFAAATSSLQKGESLLDTIQTLCQYGIDGIVMRHSSGGSPEFVAGAVSVPVINAGDGQHEHPTQALLDAFTLLEHWKLEGAPKNSLNGKTVAIVGDILHSRVARSNVHLLARLGARVILCAPQTLLPSDLSLFPAVEIEHRLDSAIPQADAIMALRIQFERQDDSLIPSKREYRHFWGLTPERMAIMKNDAVVLHPGPMNRGLEIDPEVADSSRSLILKQVENGVWVRAAILAMLVGGVKP